MRSPTALFLFWCCAMSSLGAAVACSGAEASTSASGPSDGPQTDSITVDTGIAPSRKLSSLDEEESLQTCRALAQGVLASFGPALCVIDGAFSAGFSYALTNDIDQARVACVESVDQCEACFADPETDSCELDETDTAFACELDLNGCDETVGTLEECLSGSLDWLGNALDDAPGCTELVPEDFEFTGTTSSDPYAEVPACQRLREVCPGAIE